MMAQTLAPQTPSCGTDAAGAPDRPVYLCHTYYHTYVALVLAYAEAQRGARPILALAFTKNRLTADVLDRLAHLSWVELRDLTNKPLVRRIGRMSPPAKFVLNLFLTRLFPRLEPGVARLPDLRQCRIHLFSDFHYICRYVLRRAPAGVTLVEDGTANYLPRRWRPKDAAKSLAGLHPTFGRHPKITRILVHRPHDLPADIRAKGAPLAFDDRLAALPERVRAQVRATFLGEIRYQLDARAVLVMTQPFWDFGRIDYAAHMRVYRTIVERLTARGYSVYVKPHPSDTADYRDLVPADRLLHGEFPIEILNDCLDSPIAFAVGVNTSAVHNARFALRTLNLLSTARYINDGFEENMQTIEAGLGELPGPNTAAPQPAPRPAPTGQP